VTADALVARLADCGLDPAELEPKRRLVESTIRSFHALTGTGPRDAWWVPGRLEVFGKHTDYCGGHSLVATIPRGFIFVARPREDHVVRLLDARRSERVDVDAAPASNGASSLTDADIAAVTGWRRYARVVVRRLLRNFPGAALGTDIVFASDLPSASGMSSSSALVVGVVAALAEISGLKDRSEWRDNVRTPSDAAGYFACFENGLSFGTLAGDGGVGTHGGSEDHVAIVCSGPGEVTAWRFVPIQPAGAAAVPDDWTFVIASSGVAAQKIGPALEQYNSVAHRARSLLDLWNRQATPQPSLFAALQSAPSAAERMREIATTEGASDARLEARLEQFMREDVRVLAALEAMRAADPVRLGELSASSQTDAERHLHNQIGETSALVDLARGLGAFAASAFGAGFGGSVWALIARRDAEAFAARWLANYRTRFPARTAATTFIARPGPSLMRLS
jgi:galactokinase